MTNDNDTHSNPLDSPWGFSPIAVADAITARSSKEPELHELAVIVDSHDVHINRHRPRNSKHILRQGLTQLEVDDRLQFWVSIRLIETLTLSC